MDITNDTRYFLKRVLPETSRIPCPLLRYLYAVDVDEWRLLSSSSCSRRGKEETRSSGTGIVSWPHGCINGVSQNFLPRRCNQGRPLIIFWCKRFRPSGGTSTVSLCLRCHSLADTAPPRHGRLGIHPLSSRRNR